MFGLARIFLVTGALGLATSADAQAPTPITTAFDGTYAGVSRDVSKYVTGRSQCPPGGVPAPLTITNGAVTPGADGGWQGTVSPQGALVLRNQHASRIDAQIDGQGTIKGQFSGTNCVITFVWRKQSR